MSPKTFLIATAALASAAAAQPALAAGGPPNGEPPLRAAIIFNLLDRNGDGTVDKDEASAVTGAIFAALDVDGNDKLTDDELRAVGHMGPGQRFDRGRHGDGDGPRWHQGRGAGPGHGMIGPPGDRDDTASRGPGPAMGPGGDNERPLQLRLHDFASIDTDGDGVISQEEFNAVTPPFPGRGPAR